MVKRRKDNNEDEEGRDAPDSTDPSDETSSDETSSDEVGEQKASSKKARKNKRAATPEPDPVEEHASEDSEEDEDSEDSDKAALEVAAREMTEGGGGSDGGDGSGEGGDGSDEGDEDDEELVLEAHQLGIQKYVLASYFAAGMLGAYILGRFLHAIWAYVAIRDWFSQGVPALAAIPDESKLTYATVFSGVVALLVVIRCYKSDGIRGWVNDVAGELAKVKWPSKKETTSSTITVIATATVAMTYLALLDRLWGFVTNLVYGTGT